MDRWRSRGSVSTTGIPEEVVVVLNFEELRRGVLDLRSWEDEQRNTCTFSKALIDTQRTRALCTSLHCTK